MARAHRVDSVLDLVGATPLIRLGRLSPREGATVWGKCEHLNPGGSLKDRIGAALIDAAEATGRLAPGGLVVEASAGNTAVALAQVCAVRGYDLVVAMPEKMSEEKRRILRAFGAEVVVTPNAPPDDPDHYLAVAKRIAEARGGVYLDQFANPANAQAHEATTGPEILEALDGQVDAFVCGAGTGGTSSGVARHLKEHVPDVQIVLADPEGSVLHGGQPGSYKVEGIGDDFVPPGLDLDLVDRFEVTTDAQAFLVARRLAREEGLLVGGSSGAAVAAALRVAEDLDPSANVVALLGDTGRNYVSKFLDDAWLLDLGFAEVLEAEAEGRAAGGGALDARVAGTPAQAPGGGS